MLVSVLRRFMMFLPVFVRGPLLAAKLHSAVDSEGMMPNVGALRAPAAGIFAAISILAIRKNRDFQ
jgi:hypothetical protein